MAGRILACSGCCIESLPLQKMWRRRCSRHKPQFSISPPRLAIAERNFRYGTWIGNSLSLHVEYKVLDATFKQGVIYIESEGIYNQRKALDKEAAKPKL